MYNTELLNNIPKRPGVYKMYPHELSGGMRQRIVIAMALACNPKLIIADEPTTALDVTIQAQILDLLRQLKDRINSSIMLITHDLGVIAEMADYVVVMYAGKVVEQGTAAEIFSDVEMMAREGLAVPETTKLIYELNASGFSLPLGELNEESCAAAIAAALKK